MADSPQAPTPSAASRDEDRGLLDLPDFEQLFGRFAAWCKSNPLPSLLLAAALALIGYFYFGYNAYQGLTQTSVGWMTSGWNAENDQQHCWAIVPGAILLVFLRWRDLAAAPKEPSDTGLWFVFAGILMFVAGVRCVEARYSIFAMPLLAYGTTRYLFGKAVARVILFPCAFLLFMVPIGGVIQGTVGLQVMTAKVIGSISSIFGMPITVDGAKIISLDGRFEPLEVAGGCSGIRSLMAMMTLAALYAYFVMRTPIRGMALFGLSLAFAVIGNFARVFSVVVLARIINPATATGFYHDFSGFVFFPVAVLAMVGASNLLNREWGGNIRKSPASPASSATPSAASPSSNSTETANPPPSRYDY